MGFGKPPLIEGGEQPSGPIARATKRLAAAQPRSSSGTTTSIVTARSASSPRPKRHGGLDTPILQRRSALYANARAKNPRRWTRTTRNWRRIDVVYLNPEKLEPEGESKITTENKLKMAA
jgi:hypothetical protein